MISLLQLLRSISLFTSFVQKTANAHRRVNTVDKIKVWWELVTEPAEITKGDHRVI